MDTRTPGDLEIKSEPTETEVATDILAALTAQVTQDPELDASNNNTAVLPPILKSDVWSTEDDLVDEVTDAVTASADDLGMIGGSTTTSSLMSPALHTDSAATPKSDAAPAPITLGYPAATSTSNPILSGYNPNLSPNPLMSGYNPGAVIGGPAGGGFNNNNNINHRDININPSPKDIMGTQQQLQQQQQPQHQQQQQQPQHPPPQRLNHHITTTHNPAPSACPPASGSNVKQCAACGSKILERFLLHAMERYWHTACLKCSCCQAQLGEIGSTCFTKGGMILCKNDYLRLFGSTGTCTACQQSIPASEMVMKAGGNVYHVGCFTCTQCQCRLVPGDRYSLINGSLICEHDYPKVVRGHVQVPLKPTHKVC